MSQSKSVEIRAAAPKHCEGILKLTYAAFPFEMDTEAAAAASLKTTPLALWKDGVSKWRKQRKPVAVAMDRKDRLVGTAVLRPHVGGNGRESSAVAVLARVVVDVKDRKLGVGTRLTKRMLENANILGFSQVFASIPDSLSDWYSAMGWTVGEVGQGFAWLERPEPQDDWAFVQPVPPELRGTFAPLRSEPPGPPEHGYTRIAHIATSEKSEVLLNWFFDPSIDLGSERALWKYLVEDPHRFSSIPSQTFHGLYEVLAQAGLMTDVDKRLYRAISGAGS